jgi:hypothetical protein
MTTQTQNEHRQTSMHRVGFEPTIQVFELSKTFYATDRAATKRPYFNLYILNILTLTCFNDAALTAEVLWHQS